MTTEQIKTHPEGADWIVTVSGGCPTFRGLEVLAGPLSWRTTSRAEAWRVRTTIERETGRIAYLSTIAAIR